jgi:hypothetical protein
VDTATQTWCEALRRMPIPEPRAGFVDDVLAWAVRHPAPHARPEPQRRGFTHFVTRWETWMGAAMGAAAAASVAGFLMRSPADAVTAPAPGITLALNEVRSVDVLVDSERDLRGATVRVAVSGGLSLEGFEDEREIRWQTDLERGRNVLTLPVIARSAGAGRLVAHIEHEGRTRQVTVDLTVLNSKVTPS